METKITDSSKYSRCLIRGSKILLTPEEKVRQALLRAMIEGLGFPKGLISVERGIGVRRTDIVSYTKEMRPLLLIECKACPLKEVAIEQAIGYNEVVGAPFLCLANESERITFWFEGGKRESVSFLPTFEELYGFCRRF